MRALIIEDEPLIQKSLQKLLEREGCTVDVESSGKKAIELILAESYDRIICDLMLQDISGFSVIEESKKKYDPKEIADKFIIITAYSSTQVLDQAQQYGCLLLSKPFANIQGAIKTFMTGRGHEPQ